MHLSQDRLHDNDNVYLCSLRGYIPANTTIGKTEASRGTGILGMREIASTLYKNQQSITMLPVPALDRI
jgi:hypothetical protein